MSHVTDVLGTVMHDISDRRRDSSSDPGQLAGEPLGGMGEGLDAITRFGRSCGDRVVHVRVGKLGQLGAEHPGIRRQGIRHRRPIPSRFRVFPIDLVLVLVVPMILPDPVFPQGRLERPGESFDGFIVLRGLAFRKDDLDFSQPAGRGRGVESGGAEDVARVSLVGLDGADGRLDGDGERGMVD